MTNKQLIVAFALAFVLALFAFLDPITASLCTTVVGIALSSDIQKKMDEGNARIEAIISLSEEENRELTDEEQKEVDDFHGKGDEPGEFGRLQAKLTQSKKIEERQKQIAANRLAPRLTAHMGGGSGGGNGSGIVLDGYGQRFTVPARARRHGAIKAFGEGQRAQDDAYVSGQFILAQLLGNKKSQQWLDDHGIKAAMSTDSATLGGALVPEPLESAIIRIVEENGILRQYARPATMTSSTHKIPNRTGGLTVYYPDENVTITESDKTSNQVPITAKLYATLTKVSKTLDEDSVISVANELATEIGLAFALAEDTNGFLGDGSAAFASVTGLQSKLNANSKVTGAGNTLASLTLANYEATAALLRRFVGAMPCWWCNSAVYNGSMVPIMNAAGGTSGKDIASGYDGMFLGYPVKFVQAMPDAPAASTVAAFFGTLAQAVYMGTRRGMAVETSTHYYFGDDSIAVRGTERVGITVENNDTAKAGPMVALELTA